MHGGRSHTLAADGSRFIERIVWWWLVVMVVVTVGSTLVELRWRWIDPGACLFGVVKHSTSSIF